MKVIPRFILVIALGTAFERGNAESLNNSTLPDEGAKLVDHAASAYRDKNLPLALELYRRVAADYPTSTSYGIALYNIGVVLEQLGNSQDAIAAFQRVLESPVKNEDPTGNLMEPYRNYQHKAALKISEIYEVRENFGLALRYAQDAISKYAFRSWCGTCSAEEQTAITARIKRLKALAYRASLSALDK